MLDPKRPIREADPFQGGRTGPALGHFETRMPCRTRALYRLFRSQTPANRGLCNCEAALLALASFGSAEVSIGTAGNDPLWFSNLRHRKPPQMIILLRKRPRRLRFPRARMTVCIAAIAVLVAETAAAQNCFLFFCQPGSQSQPGWQGTPVPGPDRQSEPARPFSGGGPPVFDGLCREHQRTLSRASSSRVGTFDPIYLRTSIYYSTAEPPGTIVIDPQSHFLYLVEGGGRAIRYGVGVGRTGFGRSGIATLHNKQEWPDWYPPKEMIERQPEIRRQMSELQSGIGMHGGPRNPLGAAHCICGKATRIRSIASTAPSNPGR